MRACASLVAHQPFWGAGRAQRWAWAELGAAAAVSTLAQVKRWQILLWALQHADGRWDGDDGMGRHQEPPPGKAWDPDGLGSIRNLCRAPRHLHASAPLALVLPLPWFAGEDRFSLNKARGRGLGLGKAWLFL